MKTTFILLSFLAFNSLCGQSQKRIKTLQKEIKESFYFTQFPDLDIKSISKNYACLEKHYKITPEQEKEFLSKKAFFKKFPDWVISEDHTIENASTLQESLKREHFTENKSDIFPKCLKAE